MSETRSQSQAANRRLRRARQACAYCRERKIKCDVTKRGFPCLHCEEANITCIIKERKNARKTSESVHEFTSKERASEAPQARSLNAESNRTDHIEPAFAKSTHGPDDSTSYANERTQPKSNPVANSNNHLGGMPNSSHMTAPLGLESIDTELLNLIGMNNAFFGADYSLINGQWTASESFAAQQAQQAASSRGSPPVSYIPPLGYQQSGPEALFEVDNTPPESVITNADKEFLSSQGCLTIPHPAMIRTLGLLYFEFVHPNLPIVNEAGFWDCLSVRTEVQFDLSKFSLVVLQAMLFTAISFASEDIILKCGCSSPKAARITFYRRAKLLIDTQYDSDPFRLSQAALLVTWYSPVANFLRINSQWLSIAIHFARVAGADRFQQVVDGRRKRALKRLWWGCILRDRILPLGTRRAICIRDRVVVEKDNRHYLTEEDFVDEFGRSFVHNLQQQKRIFCMINAACRLADALTPALASLFLPGLPGICLDYGGRDHTGSSRAKIAALISDMDEWRSFASCQFPYPVALGDEPQAVVLFANLLFIYFNTAVIHLCHKYLMTAEIDGQAETVDQASSRRITIAVDDITERTTEIVQLGLAKYTPISLGAYAPFPLLLHALNVHAASGSDDRALYAQDRRKLNIFTRVLTDQRKLYEGSDFPCEVVDKIVAYANEQSVTADWDAEWQSGSPKPIKKLTTIRWRDLLNTRPRLYLRLAWHIDLAFCTSMAPREEDFPRPLRSRKASV